MQGLNGSMLQSLAIMAIGKYAMQAFSIPHTATGFTDMLETETLSLKSTSWHCLQMLINAITMVEKLRTNLQTRLSTSTFMRLMALAFLPVGSLICTILSSL